MSLLDVFHPFATLVLLFIVIPNIQTLLTFNYAHSCVVFMRGRESS